MTAMSCEEFSDSAPELALGVLAGAERARALAHLDSCLTCRSRLDRLTEVGDALLELVTPVEPPLGFDARVAPRLESPPRSTHRQAVIRGLAAAAVALIVGLGTWAGVTATQPAPATPLVHNQLRSDGRVAGQIFLYKASPSWVYMTVEDVSGGNEQVTCVLESAGGAEIRVGTFRLSNGYGYWGAPVPSGSGEITNARVVTADGTVIATANFRPR